MRNANANLRRLAGSSYSLPPRSGAASFRRLAEEAERALIERPHTSSFDLESWIASTDCTRVIASQLVARLHNNAAHDEAETEGRGGAHGQEKERSFVEALGATTQEVMMAYIRELPLNELLADAIRERAAALAAADALAERQQQRTQLQKQQQQIQQKRASAAKAAAAAAVAATCSQRKVGARQALTGDVRGVKLA